MQGTDDEQTVVTAFSQFDEGEGKCKEDKYVLKFDFICRIRMLKNLNSFYRLKLAMTTFGEKFSQDEVSIDEIEIERHFLNQ